MKNRVILPFILAILCFNYFFISCDKNTDCKAIVKVVDENGATVADAAVRLYANVKTSNGGTVVADLKANGVTDGGGNVSFVFKLPAIYDIVATKTAVSQSTSTPGTTTLTGNSIIKLEEGESVEKTVTLR